MEAEGDRGKGSSSVNFVPVASGMKFVMTFFPGIIKPNGCWLACCAWATGACTCCSMSILKFYDMMLLYVI